MMTAYCASKSGVEAFAHCLRAEVGHKGVKVGVGYLSWTDTDMVRGADQDEVMRELRQRLFAQNIVFAAMCLSPLLSICALFRPKLSRAFNWWMATLVLCMAFVALLAAENGAGTAPSAAFSSLCRLELCCHGPRGVRQFTGFPSRGGYEGLRVGLIAAILFGYGPIVITSWSRISHIFAEAPLVREAAAEVDRALDENPALKVAVGPGSVSYDAEALRVIPVFRGNPMPINSTAWMTFEADGVSNEVVRRAITECRVDLWLLPSVATFVVISHLDGRNIFSPEVLSDFHATYMKQMSGRIFDQWRCKRTVTVPKA